MSKERPDIGIREYKESDIPFIYSNWLRDFKLNGMAVMKVRNNIFYLNHHKILDEIIERPTTKILVAHVTEDPDVILGFLAYEERNDRKNIAHYCLIKEQFKRFGIAKELLKKSELDLNQCEFSHWTYDLDRTIYIVEPNPKWDHNRLKDMMEGRIKEVVYIPKYPDLTYNPYLICNLGGSSERPKNKSSSV